MQCKTESDQSTDRIEPVSSTGESDPSVEDDLVWVKPSPHGLFIPELEKCLKMMGNAIQLQVKDLKKQINQVRKFQ